VQIESIFGSFRDMEAVCSYFCESSFYAVCSISLVLYAIWRQCARISANLHFMLCAVYLWFFPRFGGSVLVFLRIFILCCVQYIFGSFRDLEAMYSYFCESSFYAVCSISLVLSAIWRHCTRISANLHFMLCAVYPWFFPRYGGNVLVFLRIFILCCVQYIFGSFRDMEALYSYFCESSFYAVCSISLVLSAIWRQCARISANLHFMLCAVYLWFCPRYGGIVLVFLRLFSLYL